MTIETRQYPDLHDVATVTSPTGASLDGRVTHVTGTAVRMTFYGTGTMSVDAYARRVRGAWKTDGGDTVTFGR